MIIVDSQAVKRKVAGARRGETELVAVEAAYQMLGGSENWIARSCFNDQGEVWYWLENRQNGRRIEFRECPKVEGAEIELPAQPSNEVNRLMGRALAST